MCGIMRQRLSLVAQRLRASLMYLRALAQWLIVVCGRADIEVPGSAVRWKAKVLDNGGLQLQTTEPQHAKEGDGLLTLNRGLEADIARALGTIQVCIASQSSMIVLPQRSSSCNCVTQHARTHARARARAHTHTHTHTHTQ